MPRPARARPFATVPLAMIAKLVVAVLSGSLSLLLGLLALKAYLEALGGFTLADLLEPGSNSVNLLSLNGKAA